MRKNLAVSIFFVLNIYVSEAQESGREQETIQPFIREYMQFSRLGPGYSREMSQEIIDQFIALFERDAFLTWDLYRSASDTIRHPLTPKEYTDLARKTYDFRQPILDYPEAKTRIRLEGDHAVVHLTKINQVMDPADHPLQKNKIRLRIDLDLGREQPLIRNISFDKQVSPVRSIPLGCNLIAWSNVMSSITRDPQIRLAPNEEFVEMAINAGVELQFGGMVEIRMEKDETRGLLFSSGVFCSRIPITTTMTGYSKSYRDTLDIASENPFTCTTFERSEAVHENMEITRVEVPLLLKSYLTDRIYVKAGTAIGFVTGTTNVSYRLSRTGGGWVKNLATGELHYLDRDHELDQSGFGYYRDKSYQFPREAVNKMILSIQVAAGFEKQLGYFGFEAEPNFSFGINPLSGRTSPGNYALDEVKTFKTILRSTAMPVYEFTFGIRFLVSYLFKN